MKGIKKKYKKIGTYDVFYQKFGETEAYIDGIQNGEIFYTVWLESGIGFDTRSQAEAEILSRLVRIEEKLELLK